MIQEKNIFGEGTIRFASNFNSPGELCTLKAIKKYEKPYIDVNVKSPIKIQEVVDWINKNEIYTLNVAGNSEKTSPGIEKFVFVYLRQVLILLAETDKTFAALRKEIDNE
jgi:hypothetical protein